MSDYHEADRNDTVGHVELPAQVRRLLDEEAVIGHLATSWHDVPHVTPVWLDYDRNAEQILINVESTTLKLRNARYNPNVCISLVAPYDTAMWVVLKGAVTQIDDMGADNSHLQAQASKYLGRPKRNPGCRCILRIKVAHLRWWGEGACE
jgi:general stress protein 26